jgi:hypothetical protein
LFCACSALPLRGIAASPPTYAFKQALSPVGLYLSPLINFILEISTLTPPP